MKRKSPDAKTRTERAREAEAYEQYADEMDMLEGRITRAEYLRRERRRQQPLKRPRRLSPTRKH